jgi:hypothetical protein
LAAPYVIFCADPLNPRSVEPEFAAEVGAAQAAGFTPVVVDHNELDHRIDTDAALRRTRITDAGSAVYRGWMLRSESYRSLFDALLMRGVTLLTNPTAYDACHHAPGSYAALSDFMAKTAWLGEDKLDDADAVRSVLAPFGSSPLIIKDWVKSQATGYWIDACYVPDATDVERANRVIARFRELQGESLVGGIVFKAYQPLVPIGAPAAEFRAFEVGGRLVGCWPRTDVAGGQAGPPDDLLRQIASKVPSPFASADLAVDDRGRWWLLEVGDGQVSGLPSEQTAAPLFQAIANLIASRPV